MPAIPENVVKRIVLIMPMLSSTNDGELVNAVRAITKVLKDHDYSWHDVVARLAQPAQPTAQQGFRHRAEPPPRKPEAPPPQPRRQKSAWAEDREDVERVFIRRGELDDWSEEFLESIHDQVVNIGRSLTEKQRGKLNEILDKLGA